MHNEGIDIYFLQNARQRDSVSPNFEPKRAWRKRKKPASTMMAVKVNLCLLVAVVATMFPLASCFINLSRKTLLSPPSSAISLSAHKLYHLHLNNRRDFLHTMITSVGATASIPALFPPSVAHASYGDSSNIVMPNYIEYLIEKNKEGMPVDSLYKGPDAETQIRRVGEAANRLPEIIKLAEEKKWSQVQGLITGPLGTLLQTMNSIVSMAGTREAKDAAMRVKSDLLEIGVAAGEKSSEKCIRAAEKASKDLEKFVLIAFQ